MNQEQLRRDLRDLAANQPTQPDRLLQVEEQVRHQVVVQKFLVGAIIAVTVLVLVWLAVVA
jgi:hypothetical protein